MSMDVVPDNVCMLKVCKEESTRNSKYNETLGFTL